MTGSPWQRFDAIENNSYLNTCSYDQMPLSATLDRLSIEFFRLIWNELLIIFLVIALIPRILFLVGSQELPKEQSFYSNTIIILFLSMNFMTISLNSYNPTCLDIRHFLFVVPIMSVCSGHLLFFYIDEKSKVIKLSLILFSLLLLYPSIKLMSYSRSINYREAKSDIKNVAEVIKNNDISIVSNQVMINLINYYTEYQMSGKLIESHDFESVSHSDHCLLVSNWYTEYHSNTNLEELKASLKINPDHLEKDVFLSKELSTMEVYRIIKPTE
jgi:hypothetical protein